MQSIKTWRFIVLYILLGLAAVYVHTRSEASVPVNTPLDQFPQRAGEWRMTGQARFDSRVLAVLLPTDYLSRSYENTEGDRVSLYIGYHNGGPKSGPIHSPRQCLPGSGWNRLYDEARAIDVIGESVDYVSSVYQKDSQRQMFLYWFQVRDQLLTNEYALKFEMAKNSFLSNRRDSSFIRLSVMVRDDEDKARLVGEDFIAAFLPAIQESLPK
jgi:EpsI family protein